MTSLKKKTNIAKIRTNSHKLHNETGRWTTPKTPWDEKICHIDTKWLEEEKHFLLDFPTYTHIRSQFKNICHNMDLPNLLSHQNYRSKLPFSFEK